MTQDTRDSLYIQDLVIAVGVEAGDHVYCDITAVQPVGAPPAAVKLVGYISTDPAGADVAAVAPSGGIAIKAGCNGVITPYVTDLLFELELENGNAVIDVAEAGANDFYLILIQSDGTLLCSDKLDFT
jgi:hypothetical protein